jgi:hypothetical protein
MLAPLVVNLMILCITMMLAGWTYDLIGNWTSANRRIACCTESSIIRLRDRIGHRERFFLSDPEAAGYTQGIKTDQSHRHTLHRS